MVKLTVVPPPPAARRAGKSTRKRRAASQPDREHLLQVFTQLPAVNRSIDGEAVAAATPAGSAHLAEWELKHADVVHLIAKLGSYQSMKNPVIALEAIALAYEMQLYPPGWALEVLVDALKRWHGSQGRVSLDTALGLRGRGQDPAFKRVLIKERDQMIAINVARLVELGLSVEKAAALEEARLHSRKWDETGWRLGNVKAERIQKIYAASGLGQSARRGYSLPKWSAAETADFISKFPLDSLPLNLRRLHPSQNT